MLDEFLLELEELQKRLRERIAEQKERHDGGNYWIGTGGTSTMGHSGYHERGIRVGARAATETRSRWQESVILRTSGRITFSISASSRWRSES
jgi:uncharacterized protein with von Willebrand factor type A (vWA) domain